MCCPHVDGATAGLLRCLPHMPAPCVRWRDRGLGSAHLAMGLREPLLTQENRAVQFLVLQYTQPCPPDVSLEGTQASL